MIRWVDDATYHGEHSGFPVVELVPEDWEYLSQPLRVLRMPFRDARGVRVFRASRTMVIFSRYVTGDDIQRRTLAGTRLSTVSYIPPDTEEPWHTPTIEGFAPQLARPGRFTMQGVFPLPRPVMESMARNVVGL